MRTADIRRDTRETRIQLSLNLDGTGKADIATGVGFLDHMLELFARHGDFDLIVRCQGDTQVDGPPQRGGHRHLPGPGLCGGPGGQAGHHPLRPVPPAHGRDAGAGGRDLSGRDYLGWSVDLPAQRVGDFDTELGKEFFLAFVRACPMSLHIRQMAGENTHHILEAVFKGAGRALKMAVAPDEKHRDEIPSTKGVL